MRPGKGELKEISDIKENEKVDWASQVNTDLGGEKQDIGRAKET